MQRRSREAAGSIWALLISGAGRGGEKGRESGVRNGTWLALNPCPPSRAQPCPARPAPPNGPHRPRQPIIAPMKRLDRESPTGSNFLCRAAAQSSAEHWAGRSCVRSAAALGSVPVVVNSIFFLAVWDVSLKQKSCPSLSRSLL